MNASSVTALALLTLVAACAAPSSEATDRAEQDQISDTVSITRRPDGRFDVFCRGKNGQPDYVQTVTALQIQDDSVCSPPAPPGPSVLPASDRTVALGTNRNNVEVDQFGRGLWEGYVSFTVILTGEPGNDHARIVDASGATYEVPATATRFERLPLPVRLVATTDGSVDSAVTFRGIGVEVTRTIPIAGSALSGKYAGATPTVVRTLASDVPGMSVTLSAQATFYRNFTNGNACSRVLLTDAANQTVTLDPSSNTRRVTLKTPVQVISQSTCISSRLATPESATADFALDVSTLAFAAP